MSFRTIGLIAIAIIGLGGAAVAIANPSMLYSPTIGQGLQDGPKTRERQGLFQDLNLNANQLQEIQRLRSQNREQLAQQRQAMRQAHQELRELMASDASVEQVRQKYNEVKALRQKLADAQFENMLAMREVLTLEQRRQVADRLQQRGERFRQRMRDRVQQSDPF